ncbi:MULTISPECIES: hypothetical protein [Halomonadaceae]|uniref:hypothetical protein n=1 Tax=Halomonadaceae TaxID=28256 RepID=UPI001F195615|nr:MULTISPECIES: hypothetical protein [Halomonadaceae]MCE7517178.1 hypothetical protein [Halomonas titanicae]MDV6317947.1 hypothetical protein [Chromohalobacter sp. HP20-39]
MAEVEIEEIIDHLSSEMKRALEAAVQDVKPDANIDRNDLFRAFRRAVRRKCNTWETVPDQYVRK